MQLPNHRNFQAMFSGMPLFWALLGHFDHCSRQIYCFVVSCVFVKFLAFWANFLRFGQICCARQISCVSGKFVAFRTDLLRFGQICCFWANLLRQSDFLHFEQICCARQISCVPGRCVAPVRFLAFRTDLLRFGQICCVSGRFVAAVRFVAFRADLLRLSDFLLFCVYAKISCVIE